MLQTSLISSLLSEEDYGRASELKDRTGARLAETVLRLGMLSEADLLSAYFRAGHAAVDPQVLTGTTYRIDDINPAWLLRRRILPIEHRDGVLHVVMADPEDIESCNAVVFAAAAKSAEITVAGFSDLEDALSRAYGSEEELLLPGTYDLAGDDLDRLSDADSDAPVIRLVHRLLTLAAKKDASDIHIEPMARHLSVRFRVDGRLNEVERHPESLATAIASRIKVMAGLDIAETRLPQDGRLRVTVRGQDIDVRVSTSPIAHGESIVLRLLGQARTPLDLGQIGLPSALLTRLRGALSRPHGMILLTGPTGSGKTTTLYSAINHLRAPNVKIVTVEDPVEIVLEGVNQVQVRPEIDLTYANALRAFLRQDPDILMIGEIRDRETADIAMRAALTGHLVLSTLHTNSAAGAFTRLADIGIEPFLTASTVIASIAQRLVRRLCPDCAHERALLPSEAALFDRMEMARPSSVREARGCAACGHGGYRGRMPIMEFIGIDEEGRENIRSGQVEMLERKIPPAETLFGHGLALVAHGVTDLLEVERAVQL